MKEKILVVDDEEGTREILKQILDDVGYEVHTVASGYKAIEEVKSNKFDAIIADIKMPGVSGLRVLEAAKGVDPEIEVIMITGYASLDSSIEALRKGAANYIMKPLNIEELKVALRNALGRQRLLRENKKLIEELKASNEMLRHAKLETERWAHAIGVVYKLSEALRPLHEFTKIVSTASDFLADVVEFTMCLFFLMTRRGGKLWIGVAKRTSEANIDEAIVHLLENVENLFGRKLKKEELEITLHRFAGIEFEEEKREIKASFTHPLAYEDENIGILVVRSLDRERFDEVDIKTIYAVSSHVAQAIESHKILARSLRGKE
jgi:DNA-binding response OmpR family regulator